MIMERVACLLLAVFLLIGCNNLTSSKTKNILTTQVSQNTEAYNDKNNYSIKPQAQNELAKDFLQHYFSPWQKCDKPMRAIVTNKTNVRLQPTLKPLYNKMHKSDRSTPFDDLQVAFLVPNTPICVNSSPQNQNWYYMKTSSYNGWVQKKDIAFVNDKFIVSWRNYNYLVAIQDHNQIRIGTLYPLTDFSTEGYKVLVAAKSLNQEATSHEVTISPSDAKPFPLQLNNHNLQMMVNNLLGQPYGWGDSNGNRDCSAAMQDYYATFGIWLPRNSGSQIYGAGFVSLKNLSNSAKNKIVINKAIPYLTLLHFNGHIGTYIGSKNGEAYVFSNMWGIYIQDDDGQDDRAVVGMAAILPIDLGRDYANISKTFLDRLDGMRNLVPKSELVSQ